MGNKKQSRLRFRAARMFLITPLYCMPSAAGESGALPSSLTDECVCVCCMAGVARGRNESVEWQVAEQSSPWELAKIRPLDKTHICLNHDLICARHMRGSSHKWLRSLGHMIDCQDEERLINCLAEGHLFNTLLNTIEAIDATYLHITLAVPSSASFLLLKQIRKSHTIFIFFFLLLSWHLRRGISLYFFSFYCVNYKEHFFCFLMISNPGTWNLLKVGARLSPCNLNPIKSLNLAPTHCVVLLLNARSHSLKKRNKQCFITSKVRMCV